MSKELSKEPYEFKKEVRLVRLYNPDYGDDRICDCEHAYYRHFDTYEGMKDVGCKYCDCRTFFLKEAVT